MARFSERMRSGRKAWFESRPVRNDTAGTLAIARGSGGLRLGRCRLRCRFGPFAPFRGHDVEVAGAVAIVPGCSLQRLFYVCSTSVQVDRLTGFLRGFTLFPRCYRSASRARAGDAGINPSLGAFARVRGRCVAKLSKGACALRACACGRCVKKPCPVPCACVRVPRGNGVNPCARTGSRERWSPVLFTLLSPRSDL
jgi:hypothetical protein